MQPNYEKSIPKQNHIDVQNLCLICLPVSTFLYYCNLFIMPLKSSSIVMSGSVASIGWFMSLYCFLAVRKVCNPFCS